VIETRTGGAAVATAGKAEPRRLPHASIGIVPIVWNNADVSDLATPVAADIILDEAVRLGFDGVQDGLGFPAPADLAASLRRRGIRLAEVYVALPCTRDGPTADALSVGRDRLARLHSAGGEVLVVALEMTDDRVGRAARAAAPGTPGLSPAGWADLASTLETLAREAASLGYRLAFHGHTGSYVETMAELDRLAEATDPALVGLCLDTGHVTLGGGDPVTALRRYGERVIHVHLKDVAAAPFAQLRDGTLADFFEALRARIFTELGNGVLDLAGVIDALAARDYAGWLMVEQDSTWLPPSESAAVGRRILGFVLRAPGGSP
jgi:inosose dehydratase